MPLPTVAEGLAAAQLDAVDRALPGFVTTPWITGSAAPADRREGVPEPAEIDALAALHAGRRLISR